MTAQGVGARRQRRGTNTLASICTGIPQNRERRSLVSETVA